MEQKKKFVHDRQFQELTTRINKTIKVNKILIGDQEQQVKLMFSLERKFQYYAQKDPQILSIYKKFIHFILKENANLLSAQPYFREKTGVFRSKITKDIKEQNAQSLMKYHINYSFIDFMINRWEGEFPKKVQAYLDEFLEARRILIENNLPLAINRAKLFYRKTPRSHLNLLDFIDICTCGLINGIDKYVGEYRRVWRSVCIGRMVGNMIEEYSKTFLRLYPTDKKILYRANALKYRMQIETLEELVKAVNESFIADRERGQKIPPLPIEQHYLQTLMNGISYLSTDSRASDESSNDEEGVCLYDNTPGEDDLEEEAIKRDLFVKMNKGCKELTIIEQKVLQLKGVEF
jgi:hypothetical protein